MIRKDRELLTELARLNTAMAPLAMRIMDGSVSTSEQQDYVQRLIVVGEWLRQRANGMSGSVIEVEVITNGRLALPVHSVESYGES